MRELSELVDLILVVGAANSSNSDPSAAKLVPRWAFPATSSLTAVNWTPPGSGALRLWESLLALSAPEVLVDDVIEALRRV